MDEARRRAIRRAFERAATSYDRAAFLQQEIARRLDEHLDGMKIAPARVLDIGCGTGFGAGLLRARYPEATVIGLDIAESMLQEARHRHGARAGWRGLLARLRGTAERFAPVRADMRGLPLARACCDMAWSNLALQWTDDLAATFAEVHRVLRPEGLFLFASFGPDTLTELRAASADLDGYNHVNRFVDMHDVGDALVHAGFANPVMEMERVTLTYADLPALLRELKAIGADTVVEGRRAGLMGKATWRRLSANYERFRRDDGRLPATYEVVYGHAWAVPRRTIEDGRQIIEFRGRPR